MRRVHVISFRFSERIRVYTNIIRTTRHHDSDPSLHHYVDQRQQLCQLGALALLVG